MLAPSYPKVDTAATACTGMLSEVDNARKLMVLLSDEGFTEALTQAEDLVNDVNDTLDRVERIEEEAAEAVKDADRRDRDAEP